MRSIAPGRLVPALTALAIWLAAPTAPRAGGDPAAGKRKGLGCAACHVSSDPTADAPRIAGQNAGYLAQQLRAFRGGERANPLMDEITRRMTDADIADLAAFWSDQPAGRDAAAPREIAHGIAHEIAHEIDAIRVSHMQFPRDFPTGYVLYVTLNDAEHMVVKRHYINAVGLAAARAGKPLPEGTVVLQVNYRPRLGPDGQPIADQNGWAVDQLVSYTGMESRGGWGRELPDWLRNASWNYGKFTPAKQPSSDANQAPCLACHRREAPVGYVFTFNELREAAHAR